MKVLPVMTSLSALALGLGGSALVPHAPAKAQMPVFDTTNYAQNLLQAARALEQINNQVKSLQNQSAMLETMARNLKSVDFPQLERMTSAMRRIDQLMGEAKGIQFKVGALDQQVRGLFPGMAGNALSRDDRVVRARNALDAATANYRQSMRLQAQVAENVASDAGLLGELAATSQGSAGALQVAQAANQLLALSVKQQLQLQTLMTSEYREAAFERARRAQAEEDGRATTRRFLGGSRAQN